jgi:hypothetical protein
MRMFVVYLMMLFRNYDYTALNERAISNGFGRKWSWPDCKVLSRHTLGGTEENHENYRSG